jgi:hypothetical protein
MQDTVTRGIEQAEEALDTFGNEAFPIYHSITDSGEYSLERVVMREFNVCQLLYGLGYGVDPSYQYEPGPIVSGFMREDYEAACAIVRGGGEWWEWQGLDDVPDGYISPEEWDEVNVSVALRILGGDFAMGDLISEYFSIEEVSHTDAEAKLTEYMRLLYEADRAYREAGWEL